MSGQLKPLTGRIVDIAHLTQLSTYYFGLSTISPMDLSHFFECDMDID